MGSRQQSRNGRSTTELGDAKGFFNLLTKIFKAPALTRCLRKRDCIEPVEALVCLKSDVLVVRLLRISMPGKEGCQFTGDALWVFGCPVKVLRKFSKRRGGGQTFDNALQYGLGPRI